MDKLRVSLVQFNITWRSKQQNFNRIQALLDGVRSDLILLPEMFQTGFSVREPAEAERMDGPSVQFLQDLATEHASTVVGTFMCTEDDRIFNRMLVMGPGGILGQYDKQHLFGLSHETEHFSAGNDKVDVVVNGWKLRLIICYDLRFPYLSYNDSQFDGLLVSANWPALRIGHWDALLRARAIENQSYVAAVNRVGMDPFGVSYPGHSSVYDPAGELELCFTGEHVRTVEWDREVLEDYRMRLPFLKDQRS